jgi:hypothetical protein
LFIFVPKGPESLFDPVNNGCRRPRRINGSVSHGGSIIIEIGLLFPYPAMTRDHPPKKTVDAEETRFPAGLPLSFAFRDASVQALGVAPRQHAEPRGSAIPHAPENGSKVVPAV